MKGGKWIAKYIENNNTLFAAQIINNMNIGGERREAKCRFIRTEKKTLTTSQIFQNVQSPKKISQQKIFKKSDCIRASFAISRINLWDTNGVYGRQKSITSLPAAIKFVIIEIGSFKLFIRLDSHVYRIGTAQSDTGGIPAVRFATVLFDIASTAGRSPSLL